MLHIYIYIYATRSMFLFIPQELKNQFCIRLRLNLFVHVCSCFIFHSGCFYVLDSKPSFSDSIYLFMWVFCFDVHTGHFYYVTTLTVHSILDIYISICRDLFCFPFYVCFSTTSHIVYWSLRLFVLFCSVFHVFAVPFFSMVLNPTAHVV